MIQPLIEWRSACRARRQMRIRPMQVTLDPHFGDYVIGFIAKHVPVDAALRDRIAAYVAPYVREGQHVDRRQAIVLWWLVLENDSTRSSNRSQRDYQSERE